ncbi:hypothetical protein ACFQVC_03120 [Streptomyces monticola]|uniref:Uncharacterized protein n=1 Tax=Streptomyces monticola TaxID=2666263 RepID=A0ABW2JB15_9ACTN
MDDPLGTADVIAAAFEDWQGSKQGYVSVYDVMGNPLSGTSNR